MDVASATSARTRSGQSRLLGHEQPRIFTPPLRELTEETTLGYEVIRFAEQILDIELIPWQRWLYIHALEVIGELDGSGEWMFRYRMVLVLVGRQNGKTTLGAILALYFLYCLMAGLVIGAAQDLEQAEDTWEACVEMAESNPELSDEVAHVWRTNGAKRLQLTGGRDYRVRASTRKAGRGKSADLVLLDELREHQNWEAYSALSKTQQARKSALLWCMSNAGDATSVVLRHFRLKAHAALGDPDGIVDDLSKPADEDGFEISDDTLGIFEWSAPPNSSRTDEDAWAAANPSLGYTMSYRAVRSAAANDPDDVFTTEVLCQWVTVATVSPFPEGAWEEGLDESSAIAPDSEMVFGVDIAADRGHASICVAGMRSDRNYHVEVVAYRGGLAWVKDWFTEHAGGERTVKVALQARGAPVSSMAEILNAIQGVEVIPCKGPDVAGWCGRFWDGVAAHVKPAAEGSAKVYHRTQPILDLAAMIAATRPLGDGAWAWDRNRSLEDISALVAATMAFGALTAVEPPAPISAYDEHDLLFV